LILGFGILKASLHISRVLFKRRRMQRCFLPANSREIDDRTPIKLRVLPYQACIDAGYTCVFPIRKEASPNSEEGITLHTMFEIQLHEDASPNSDSGSTVSCTKTAAFWTIREVGKGMN
jgi:hypothetical protein